MNAYDKQTGQFEKLIDNPQFSSNLEILLEPVRDGEAMPLPIGLVRHIQQRSLGIFSVLSNRDVISNLFGETVEISTESFTVGITLDEKAGPFPMVRYDLAIPETDDSLARDAEYLIDTRYLNRLEMGREICQPVGVAITLSRLLKPIAEVTSAIYDL